MRLRRKIAAVAALVALALAVVAVSTTASEAVATNGTIIVED